MRIDWQRALVVELALLAGFELGVRARLRARAAGDAPLLGLLDDLALDQGVRHGRGDTGGDDPPQAADRPQRSRARMRCAVREWAVSTPTRRLARSRETCNLLA